MRRWPLFSLRGFKTNIINMSGCAFNIWVDEYNILVEYLLSKAGSINYDAN